MAKRFTETTIWDEDWFFKLTAPYKLFWFYILSKCDHAGIWKPNTELFNYFNNCDVNLPDAMKYFNKGKERVKMLPSMHWLLEDFFVFQYGTKFNVNNLVHKSIKERYLQEGVSLTSIRGIVEVEDRVKDKDKDKDKEKDKE